MGSENIRTPRPEDLIANRAPLTTFPERLGSPRPATSHSAKVVPLAASRSDYRSVLVDRALLFAGLQPRDAMDIASAAYIQQLRRHECLFQSGELVLRASVVFSGRLKSVASNANGQEIIVRVYNTDDLIGGPQAATSRCSQETAKALEDTIIISWDVRIFESFCKSIPALRTNVSAVLAYRLRELEERYLELATELVPVRLARTLLRLGGASNRPDMPQRVQLSQEELAQLAGTTLFTVSRQLSDWESKGIVSRRRELVEIHKVEALRQFAEALE